MGIRMTGRGTNRERGSRGTPPATGPAGADVASGSCGSCPWSVDASGTLRIGEGTLGSPNVRRGEPWPWAPQREAIVRVVLDGTVRCGEHAYGLFAGCARLEEIDLSNLDTSSATLMTEMFAGCRSLRSLDLTPLDTSSVSGTYAMFSGCQSLAELDLSAMDTSRVEFMKSMFRGCSSLVDLDCSSLDLSLVTDMSHMFAECSSLHTLRLRGPRSKSLEELSFLLAGCTSLRSADLTGLDTSRAQVFFGVYAGGVPLEELTVGDGYLVWTPGMFPDSTAADGRWWSARKGAWLTKEDIVRDRGGVADTYTVYETPRRT